MVVLVDRTPSASRLSRRHTTTVVRLPRTMNPSENRFHRHVRATWSPCAASPDWSWSSGIHLAATAMSSSCLSSSTAHQHSMHGTADKTRRA